MRVHTYLGDVGRTKTKPVLIFELVRLQHDVLEPRWVTITHDSYLGSLTPDEKESDVFGVR
jgi:hypothetical protein